MAQYDYTPGMLRDVYVTIHGKRMTLVAYLSSIDPEFRMEYDSEIEREEDDWLNSLDLADPDEFPEFDESREVPNDNPAS